MMRGNSAAIRPALMCWMVSPDPQANTRATASPGPGTGSGTLLSTKGELGPFKTMALISIPEHEVGGLEEERAVDAVGVQEGGRIAHQLLDAELLHVAVAAVDLHGPARDLPRRLRRHGLRERAERAVPAVLLVIREEAGAVDVGAGGVDQHAHLRELRADAVVLDQRFAALDAHLRPVDGFLVQGTRDAEDRSTGVSIRLRKEFRQHVEAVVDLAHHVLVRDEAILKDELGVIGEALAHLVVHAPDGEALAVPLREEACGRLRHRPARLSLRKQQVMARAVPVRDEVLHAVYDPAACRLAGASAERHRVRKK